MYPKLVKQIAQSDAIRYFSDVFDLDFSKLKQNPLYDGAANLVYCHKGKANQYLRISYRNDRSEAMICSELDFVNYLAENGLSCARPLLSSQGRFCEILEFEGITLKGALFTEAAGKFLYQMQFRMPQGLTLNKFWFRCGELLGRLHALSTAYAKQNEVVRFNWLNRHEESLSWILPEPLARHQSILQNAIAEIRKIDPADGSFGLCHNDFNIGNFKLDYSNSDGVINIFDFDDSGYNYFMYDLACFWELSTGWAMNMVARNEYKEFMHKSFSTMLEGYHKYHEPGIDATGLLPLFLKAVHIENILEPLRELHYAEKPPRLNKEMKYHFHCLEHDIDYMGLFDDIFSAERPYSM